MRGKMLSVGRGLAAFAAFASLAALPASAQVQIRLGDPSRANYSELHDGLKEGSPEADSILVLLRSNDPVLLWKRANSAIAGEESWGHGLIALTRLAELRIPAYGDSARAFRERLNDGDVVFAPGEDPATLMDPMIAIEEELKRAEVGDSAILADLLSRVPTGGYILPDAWVFGRLGAGATDSVVNRFLATPDPKLRARYLTLLSFSSDPALIPFLARVYAASDSFAIPPRWAVRASDGLTWIGTKESLSALQAARARARARGIYADPKYGRNDLDFLANDSASVVARTGKWIDDWLVALR